MLQAAKKLSAPRREFLCEPEEVKWAVDEYLRICQERQGKDYAMVLSVDTETTGIHPIRDRISIFSFYSPEKITIPQLKIHREDVAFVALGGTLGKQENIDAMRPILEHPNIVKCGANISGFDYFMFRNHGIHMADPMHDTIVMDWMYNENRAGRHGLKQTMFDFHRYKMEDYKTAGGGEMDIRKWDFESAFRYPAIDAWAGYKVWDHLQKKLKEFRFEGYDITAYDFYCGFLMDVQWVLRRMVGRGIRFDVPYLKELAPKIVKEMGDIERWFNRQWSQLQFDKKTYYITDAELRNDNERERKGLDRKVLGIRPMNVKSDKQLKYLYFQLLGKEVLAVNTSKKTGESNPSLKADVLKEYVEMEGCEYSENLLRFRQLSKLNNTYIGNISDDEDDHTGGRSDDKGLLSKVHEGRIYTNFKMGPVTGRLASANPNLMNIPTRTDLGKAIKQAFIPADEHLLVAADYSQLEMRIFAHFAQEQAMINAILEGKDLHCVTASLMFGVDYELLLNAKKVTDSVGEGEKPPEWTREYMDMRHIGKTIGFALLYGAGPKKIGSQIKKSMKEAKEYINLFFQAYPGAKKWIDSVHRSCRATAKVWTYLSRPRRLSEIRSHENWLAKRAERQAVNSIIQGSAADFVLMAMIRVEEDEFLYRHGCQLLLQVHDELVFEVPKKHVEVVMPRIVELMEYSVGEDPATQLPPLSVPLPVSIHAGSNWREAK